jgi:hypothetical protein
MDLGALTVIVAFGVLVVLLLTWVLRRRRRPSPSWVSFWPEPRLKRRPVRKVRPIGPFE